MEGINLVFLTGFHYNRKQQNLTKGESAMDYRSNTRRAALILAGGRSSRMGRDKVTLSFGGETLLARAVRFWRESGRVDAVYVAVGRADHIPQLPEGAIPVADLVESRGPLGGLHAAFQATDAEFLWVCGVDMPFLTPEAILPEPKGDAIVYRRQGRPEPLLGVYRRSVLPVIEEMLAGNIGKLRVLLDRVGTEYVDAPPELEPVFRNVNTPEEFWRAKAGAPPMVGLAAWSGTGKTTFLERLIPELTRRGVRVAVVKHTHHIPGPETPDKDSHRLRRAGAAQVLLLCRDEMPLEESRRHLPEVDLILVEGFKHSDLPKLELHRKAVDKPLITPPENRVAVLTDEPLAIEGIQLGLEDADKCAELLCSIFQLHRASP